MTMLELIKRALGFGSDADLIPDEAFAKIGDELDKRQSQAGFLTRASVAFDQMMFEARDAKVRFEQERDETRAAFNRNMERLEEEIRQLDVFIESVGPVLPALADGYDAAADARNSYSVAVETKRRRGDRHMPIVASQKAVAA
jgi:hypothetical protein